MTKSEKPSALGVALSFGEVMKKINYRIDWQRNASFWARFCNYNCIQSSIELTGLSMTTFVGYAELDLKMLCLLQVFLHRLTPLHMQMCRTIAFIGLVLYAPFGNLSKNRLEVHQPSTSDQIGHESPLVFL